MKIIDGYKKCTRCKELKSVDLFHFSNRKKGYLNSMCKECYNKYRKEYNANNRERMREHSKKYYDENKDFLLVKLKFKRMMEGRI